MSSAKRRVLPCVLMSVVLLQGCAAAVVPLIVGSIAFSGFATYKTVQTVTGGSVSVGFNEESEAVNTEALAAILRPAVWPGNEAEIAIANRLDSLAAFDGVVTPNTVSQANEALNIPDDLTLLTNSERSSALQRICEETGADAIIVTRDLGVEQDTNVLSFQRANATQYVEITVYSNKAKEIVLNAQMEIVMEAGSSVPNMQEVLVVAGESIAERIVELKEAGNS